MRATERRARLAVLLFAALLLRVLVPAGWMVGPQASGHLTIGLCNSNASVTIAIPAKQPPGDSIDEPAELCAFAGHGAGAAPPDPPVLAGPAPFAAIWQPGRADGLSPASAVHLPPPTGPPVPA